MAKTAQEDSWRQWLSFSAFTLAGTAFEGGAPSLPSNAKPVAQATRKFTGSAR
ncbi:hypothetical protein [Candidatus Pantoea deserta]|uniref:hypothetical protein n=1 Tax=Candidatus Pantoea deserta TaxID=1869313 RepID=UPI0018F4070A|nr:hypothetical protein [Pantoea deserta]